jgi:hypothetical protein
MTDNIKLWAHHPGGTISYLESLPAEWVPGQDIHAENIAADMTDVTSLSPRPISGWVTNDGGKTFSEPALPQNIEKITVISRDDLFRRCTDDEAEKIDKAISDQPTRVRLILESVANFRSDDEIWPILRDIMVRLFRKSRASELLAQSEVG